MSESDVSVRAIKLARIVEILSWVFLALSLFSGVVLAAIKDEGAFGETDRPFAALGLTIAIAGTFQCLLVAMVATYMQARLSSTTSGA